MKFTRTEVGIIFDSQNSTYKTYAVLLTIEKNGEKNDKLILIKSKLDLEKDYEINKIAELMIKYSFGEEKFGVREIYFDDNNIELLKKIYE